MSMKNKQGKLIEKKMESVHENFQIFDSGLWINKDFPFLGASPDGIVSCDCCGIGLCEIKVTIMQIFMEFKALYSRTRIMMLAGS